MRVIPRVVGEGLCHTRYLDSLGTEGRWCKMTRCCRGTEIERHAHLQMRLKAVWWAAIGDDNVFETVLKATTNQFWVRRQRCVQVH